MKIKWLGHSSFMITSDSGIKIITDPYKTGSGLRYGEIEESADVVTVSHEHGDHNNVSAVQGNPKVVRETTKIKGIEFRGVHSYHDKAGGRQRGRNTIFCFEVDGIRVCHLGDLGHEIDNKQVAEIGKVDILLIPVGGYYTIDARVASQICGTLAPRVIIPIHYKTNKCDYPIVSVDDFLKAKTHVNRLEANEVDFKKGELPATTQIIVLKSAL